MPLGYECQEGFGVTLGRPPGLLCTSHDPQVAPGPCLDQAQKCFLGGHFDWGLLQGGTLRWALPSHAIWVIRLARAGYIPHPDLPYQSYAIWWACGHPLWVVGAQKRVKLAKEVSWLSLREPTSNFISVAGGLSWMDRLPSSRRFDRR